MGGESEIKIGSVVKGEFSGKVVDIKKTMGFGGLTTVVIECKLKMEELKDVLNKEGKRRTSRKKTSSAKRKD